MPPDLSKVGHLARAEQAVCTPWDHTCSDGACLDHTCLDHTYPVLSHISSPPSLGGPSCWFPALSLSLLGWAVKLWLSSFRQNGGRLSSGWADSSAPDPRGRPKLESGAVGGGEVFCLETDAGAPRSATSDCLPGPLPDIPCIWGFTPALPVLPPTVRCPSDWPSSQNWRTAAAPQRFLPSSRCASLKVHSKGNATPSLRLWQVQVPPSRIF